MLFNFRVVLRDWISSNVIRWLASFVLILLFYRGYLIFEMVSRPLTIYPYDPALVHPFWIPSGFQSDFGVVILLGSIFALFSKIFFKKKDSRTVEAVIVFTSAAFLFLTVMHAIVLTHFSVPLTWELIVRFTGLITWREVLTHFSVWKMLVLIGVIGCVWKWIRSSVAYRSSAVILTVFFGVHLFYAGLVFFNPKKKVVFTEGVMIPPGFYQVVQAYYLRSAFQEIAGNYSPQQFQQKRLLTDSDPRLEVPEIRIQGLPRYAKKNVILIQLESLSDRWFQEQGRAGRRVMPFLSQLYDRGWKMKRHYSAGNASSKARFGLLTGLYPEVKPGVWGAKGCALPAMPQILGLTGFLVSPASIYFCFPLDLLKNNQMQIIDRSSFADDPQFRDIDLSARHEIRAMKRFAQECASQANPFFAMYSSYVPHSPYLPYPGSDLNPVPIPDPKQDFNGFQYALYLNSLHVLDHALQQFFEEAAKHSFYHETLFFITADHGQTFFRGFFTHGNWVYEEIIRVPAFFWTPDGKPGETEVLTSHVDLLPTILDLQGKWVRSENFQGYSWYRPIRRPEVYNSGELHVASIQENGEKYVLDPIKREALYFDLKKDPMEKSPEKADPQSPQLQRLAAFYRDQTKLLESRR